MMPIGLAAPRSLRPVPCQGLRSDQGPLFLLDEGLGKIKAAVEARRDKSLARFARTSAPLVTGVADAIVAPKDLKGVPSADFVNRYMRNSAVQQRMADFLGVKKD